MNLLVTLRGNWRKEIGACVSTGLFRANRAWPSFRPRHGVYPGHNLAKNKMLCWRQFWSNSIPVNVTKTYENWMNQRRTIILTSARGVDVWPVLGQAVTPHPHPHVNYIRGCAGPRSDLYAAHLSPLTSHFPSLGIELALALMSNFILHIHTQFTLKL